MKRSRGFTTIELLIAISVMAILASLAIPSYLDFFEKSRLRGATEAVYEQLQHARTLSIKKSTPIIVDFSADGSTTWALGITDVSGGCDAAVTSASTANACVIEYDNDPSVVSGNIGADDKVLMRMASTDFTNITLKGSGGNSPLFDTEKDATTTPTRLDACATTTAVAAACFEPVQGLSRKTTDAGHIELSKGGYKLQVRIEETGIMTVCDPSGVNEPHVIGYKKCS